MHYLNGDYSFVTLLFFTLQLTATDRGGMGSSTSTNLTIEVEDINDNAPQFEQNYTFSISSSLQIGSSVGNLTAVDLDSSEQNNHVTYILLRGGFGKFFIHPDTGKDCKLLPMLHIACYLL